VRRIDPDDAGDAGDVAQRHLPDDEAAPIVTDKNSLLDPEMIEQFDEIAGELFDVVGLHRLRSVGLAVAALVGRNHAQARLAEGLDLMTPGIGDLGPAVAEHDRRRIRLRAGLVISHPDAVHASVLKGRHFGHGSLGSQAAAVIWTARGG
jgi:hypothetical protein